jgi:hypothetical protein
VSDDYLNAIAVETTTALELEAAGVWERRDGGYLIVADEMVKVAIDFHERTNPPGGRVRPARGAPPVGRRSRVRLGDPQSFLPSSAPVAHGACSRRYAWYRGFLSVCPRARRTIWSVR